MNSLKKSFISLALSNGALKFGNFILKSGRNSPYFFNAGVFYQGNALRKIGQCYANTLMENKKVFDHLFGPAYKGIPLATSTAIALSDLGINTTVTFNRKEAKDHGEGGILIGSPLFGNTIIVDDVITKGTAFREAYNFINQNGGKICGMIIALDRCERGIHNKSTLDEIKDLGIDVFSIVNIFDIIEYLEDFKKEIIFDFNRAQAINNLHNYLKLYGVKP